MRSRSFPVAMVAASACLLAACGSSGNGAATTSLPANSNADGSSATTSPAAVNPNAPEVVEPGDIPDNQVFVTFPSPDGTFTVKVPEGWAQTTDAGKTTFTDKYNSITIESADASSPPTVDSVRTNGLADVSSDPTFHLVDVKPVTRKSGDGIVATYEIGSAPNPVTNKKAELAVERYFFTKGGHDAVLTLSGAKGADNVDPWRTVTDSLTWK